MRKAMAAALTGLALVGLAGTASADTTPIYKTKAELQQQADEFTAHQLQTFPQIFPGARFVTPGLWGGERDGVLEDGQQYMANYVKYFYDGEKRGLITQVNAPGLYTDSPEQACERQQCTSIVSDNAGGVTVFSGPDQYNGRTVTNFRPNGEVVWAQGAAWDDPAQLAAVAADRAYTFTK